MKAILSWRRIGGWHVELADPPLPIADLIKLEELQNVLREHWPSCRVTECRGFAKLILRDIPYIAAEPLMRLLALRYRQHPIMSESIKWELAQLLVDKNNKGRWVHGKDTLFFVDLLILKKQLS
jgi:hypothetical protein